MVWRKKRFKPHLIDLTLYRSNLQFSVRRRNALIPVVPLPSECPYSGGWNAEEIRAMKENRETAKIIYNAVVHGTK